MSRKMVTVRKIDDVLPIEGADKVELLQLGGWQCVSGKGNFKRHDYAVFFEIDSFLPMSDDRFSFLAKNATTFEGVVGARIKTIRLRGQLSQGLCLPLSEFPEIPEDIYGEDGEHIDFADLLGVKKWEPNIPAQLAGKVKGNFPSFIPKTEQERVQNLWGKLTAPGTKVYKGNDSEGNPILEDVPGNKYDAYTYEVTVKLDGSSMTIYMDADGNFGVCSRNLDLIETEGNSFWNVVRRDGLEEKMRKLFMSYGPMAVQGELIGPGIQGNHEGLKEIEFRVFDIYDIKSGTYVTPHQRFMLTDLYGFKRVPIVHNSTVFDTSLGLDYWLAKASGPSMVADTREGLVFTCNEDPSFSFKIISTDYLLKYPDR